MKVGVLGTGSVGRTIGTSGTVSLEALGGGTEMYLPLWLRLMGAVGPQFNIKVVS